MIEKPCDCCADGSGTTSTLSNLPGLTQITYRIGTHNSFKTNMLYDMSRQRPLDVLTTRDDTDFAVAMADAWASVLDVLTFYQERYANEHYLRTATQTLSVYELGKEVGYKLAPATAAKTYLAFTVDNANGAPTTVSVDEGVKVQSVPGQDELPQIFETLESVVANVAWNEFQVQRYEAQTTFSGQTSAWFDGDTLTCKVGDNLLFQSGSSVQIVRILSLTIDSTLHQTQITWGQGLSVFSNPHIGVLGRVCSLFGYNAADWNTLGTALQTTYPHSGWADQNITTNVVNLDAQYTDVLPTARIVFRKSSGVVVRTINSVSEVSLSKFLISGKSTQVTLSSSLTASDAVTPMSVSVLVETATLTLGKTAITTPLTGDLIEVEEEQDRPDVGRTVVIAGKASRIAPVNAVTVPATSRTLETVIAAGTSLRVDTVADGGGGKLAFTVFQDDGTTLTLPALSTSQFAYQSPLDTDPTVGEAVTIAADQTAALTSPLQFSIDQTLTTPFDRASTKVYGNAVLASHGESKVETLGSGNGAKTFQSFTLRGGPVTYLAAATESGYETTLSVRVDGLLWSQVDQFTDAEPTDRVYDARQDSKQATTIDFGDGKHGSRLPTGIENVVAYYRQGAGVAGNVRAGQLSLMQTRPLGMKSVVNPLAASGGSDAEDIADAQQTIPSTILTLGRIVSLQDFQDFAFRFPSVYKALVQDVWLGQIPTVFLSVLGADGSSVDLDTLRGSIDSVRDIHTPLTIMNGEVYAFRVALQVLAKEEYDQDTVFEAVKTQLTSDFGFDKMQFGLSVSASEILKSVQSVAGVEAAVVTQLARISDPTTTPIDPLPADFSKVDSGVLRPASMLVVDENQITIEELSREI
ncbi:MAG: putative baseplate assembly protein [Armatimonadetes bacterium]|nr:putative baseplate assembly protein [Armatimonadota bacterium]